MHPNKLNDDWILCYSKTAPGKPYYFNVRNGEALWKHEVENHLNKNSTRVNRVFGKNMHIELKESPLTSNFFSQIYNCNNAPSFARTMANNIHPGSGRTLENDNFTSHFPNDGLKHQNTNFTSHLPNFTSLFPNVGVNQQTVNTTSPIFTPTTLSRYMPNEFNSYSRTHMFKPTIFEQTVNTENYREMSVDALSVPISSHFKNYEEPTIHSVFNKEKNAPNLVVTSTPLGKRVNVFNTTSTSYDTNKSTQTELDTDETTELTNSQMLSPDPQILDINMKVHKSGIFISYNDPYKKTINIPTRQLRNSIKNNLSQYMSPIELHENEFKTSQNSASSTFENPGRNPTQKISELSDSFRTDLHINCPRNDEISDVPIHDEGSQRIKKQVTRWLFNHSNDFISRTDKQVQFPECFKPKETLNQHINTSELLKESNMVTTDVLKDQRPNTSNRSNPRSIFDPDNNNVDLRLLLNARKRPKLNDENGEKNKIEEPLSRKKRVSFKDFLIEESFDDMLQIHDEDQLQQLSDGHRSTLRLEYCYILVDMDVLFDHLDLIVEYVMTDKDNRLFIPCWLSEMIESISLGDSRGRQNVAVARRLYRMITSPPPYFVVQSVEMQDRTFEDTRSAMSCCLYLRRLRYRVTLISNDSNSQRRAILYKIPCFTVSDISNYVNSIEQEMSYDFSINCLSYKEQNGIETDVTKLQRLSTNDNKNIILDNKNKEIRICFTNNKFDRNQNVIDNQIVINKSQVIDDKQKVIDNKQNVNDRQKVIDQNVNDITKDLTNKTRSLIENDDGIYNNHDDDRECSVSPVFFYDNTGDRSLNTNNNLVATIKTGVPNYLAFKHLKSDVVIQKSKVNFEKIKNVKRSEFKHYSEINNTNHQNVRESNAGVQNSKDNFEKIRNVKGSEFKNYSEINDTNHQNVRESNAGVQNSKDNFEKIRNLKGSEFKNYSEINDTNHQNVRESNAGVQNSKDNFEKIRNVKGREFKNYSQINEMNNKNVRENYNRFLRCLPKSSKTWSLDDCLMRFNIESDKIDETVVTSIDGWMCNLIQVMEEALMDIFKDIIAMKDILQIGNLNDYLEIASTVYKDNSKIQIIAGKLLKLLEEKVLKNGNMKPKLILNHFAKALGCSILLIEQLKLLHTNNDELIDAETTLYKIFEMLKNYEQPDIESPPRSVATDTCTSIRQNYNPVVDVKGYVLKHFPNVAKDVSEKEVMHYNKDNPKVFRTCGKNLNSLRIDSRNSMTLEYTKDGLKNESANNISKKTANAESNIAIIANKKLVNDENEEPFDNILISKPKEKDSDAKNQIPNKTNAILGDADTGNTFGVTLNGPKVIRNIKLLESYEKKFNDNKTSNSQLNLMEIKENDESVKSVFKSDQDNIELASQMDGVKKSCTSLNIKNNNNDDSIDGIGYTNKTYKNNLLKKFIYDLNLSFSYVRNFVDNTISKILRDKLKENTKNDLKEKTKKCEEQLELIIEDLKGIIQRESYEDCSKSLQGILKNEKNKLYDEFFSIYIAYIKKCQKNAVLLRDALKLMYSLLDDDINLSPMSA